ncbi:putative abieta-7,13-dien-18-ol hydroxylase [Helianthus anomalus]
MCRLIGCDFKLLIVYPMDLLRVSITKLNLIQKLKEHILKDLLGDGTFRVDQVKFKNREKSQGVNFQGKYLESSAVKLAHIITESANNRQSIDDISDLFMKISSIQYSK